MMRQLSRRVPIRGRDYSLAYQTCGPLACNTYVITTGSNSCKRAVIIDPAMTNAAEYDAVEAHCDGSEVTDILLTHGHADHVMGLYHCHELWPNASIHIHPMEMEENFRLAPEVGPMFGLAVPTPLPEPTHELVDGQILSFGTAAGGSTNDLALQVLHTPGHAPGHVAFLDVANNNDDVSARSSNGGAVIWSGDLLFRGSVGRTDFSNASFDDLLLSLYRLYHHVGQYQQQDQHPHQQPPLTAPTDATEATVKEPPASSSIVLSGHTTPTYLQKERESNTVVQMAFERYHHFNEGDDNFVDVASSSAAHDMYLRAKERHGWIV